MGGTSRRDTFMRAIQRIRDLVESVEFEQLNAAAIENRWNALKEYWNQFVQEHLTLVEGADEQDLQRYETACARTEQKFNRANDALRARLGVLQLRPGEEGIGAQQNAPAAVRVHVPMAADPNLNTYGQFDGDQAKWYGWRDQFKAVVHDNDNLNPVMKLQFLLDSVTGVAKKMLGTWELTETNYAAAWKRLYEMYNDERFVIHFHLRKLFRLPKLVKATYDELRLLIDTTRLSTRQLANLGVPVDSWNIILVYMLEQRLDTPTSRDWEDQRRKHMGNEPGHLKELLAFLDTRAIEIAHTRSEQEGDVYRQQVERRRTSSTAVAANAGASSRPMGRQRDRSHQTASRAEQRSVNKAIAICRMCKADHVLYRCRDFLNLELGEREKQVKNWNVCPNCLITEHKTAHCESGPCARCQGRQFHNSCLCPLLEAKLRENQPKSSLVQRK